MLEDPSRGGRQRQINRCRSWRRVGRRQYFVTELPRLYICNLIEELWIFANQCEQQVFGLDSGRPGFRCFITAKENDSACPLGEYFKHDCVVCYLSRLQLAMRNVWTRMCRKSAGRAREQTSPPGIGGAASRGTRRAGWYYRNASVASLHQSRATAHPCFFNKERCAKV